MDGERFGIEIGLDPRDVIALEEQDTWIRRAAEADKCAAFATEKATTWIDEAARLRTIIGELSTSNSKLAVQRNVAYLLAAVSTGVAVYMAVWG